MAFSGPLSQADLLAIWQSTMDDAYVEPFIEAGDGLGLEAWNQLFAQLARVSQAVDVSMQSLFILPWSGQTNPPASGPKRATVELTLARSGRPDLPLILAAGFTWVDEVIPDWSPTGTQPFNSGLRYTLVADVVFEPGESGPLSVLAVAERPGYGYNNPPPGALSFVEQPGTQFYNVEAAVTNTLQSLPVSPGNVAAAKLIVIDVPHVVVPGHVGQYVEITAGTNAGVVARMISFRAADTSVPDGGAVGLELLAAVHASSFTNQSVTPFADGETCTIMHPVPPAVVGYATFKHATTVGAVLKASFVMRCGALAPGDVIAGGQSGSSLMVDAVYSDASVLQTTDQTEPPPPPVVPGGLPSTEQWRVLDWVADWGLTVTNAAQPSGGTAGVLDLLGRERNLPRASGEEDDVYRERIAQIADVVTPNAVKRRLNKTLTQGPLNLSWCLREIGSPLFPGFFYDLDFYDYDAQYFFGISASGFQPNEPVTQTVNGVVATGRILLEDAPISPYPGVGVLVPGAAGTTGQRGSRGVIGVCGLRSGRPFVAGVPVVGTLSGASSTPTTVVGGIGNQLQGNVASGAPMSNAWRVLVDYLRMRAYFVVQVQRSDAGDFGFGWGSTTLGIGANADWWDAGPAWNDFYDGSPRIFALNAGPAYAAVNQIRAAGVTVEFFPLDGACS
jgi:hypothetical protein